jgi:transposase
MSQPEVAQALGVSVSFITKLLRRHRETGSVAAKAHGGGRAAGPDATALEALASLVAGQADATPEELRDGLSAGHRVTTSVPAVCRALAKLGLPRERSRSTRAGATRRG